MPIRQSRYISEEAETGATNMNKYQLVSNMTDNPEETSTIKYPSSKALNDGLANKQNTLTAGEGITIEDNVISATGGSSSSGVINKREGYAISADNTTQLDVSEDFTNVIEVYKNGQEIYEGRDYTISSNVITFTTALATTDYIRVKRN